mmetsp:Transcript_14541/g.24131  ORF Transcript_14541/g.24131 Transcript_14541/m.24131 type:complete len:232 (-) Transcript_14541:1597-2292(-)
MRMRQSMHNFAVACSFCRTQTVTAGWGCWLTPNLLPIGSRTASEQRTFSGRLRACLASILCGLSSPLHTSISTSGTIKTVPGRCSSGQRGSAQSPSCVRMRMKIPMWTSVMKMCSCGLKTRPKRKPKQTKMLSCLLFAAKTRVYTPRTRLCITTSTITRIAWPSCARRWSVTRGAALRIAFGVCWTGGRVKSMRPCTNLRRRTNTPPTTHMCCAFTVWLAPPWGYTQRRWR